MNMKDFISSWNGIRCHNKHIKFYKIWFRHLNIKLDLNINNGGEILTHAQTAR
jgi:hypothetical protein